MRSRIVHEVEYTQMRSGLGTSSVIAVVKHHSMMKRRTIRPRSTIRGHSISSTERNQVGDLVYASRAEETSAARSLPSSEDIAQFTCKCLCGLQH